MKDDLATDLSNIINNMTLNLSNVDVSVIAQGALMLENVAIKGNEKPEISKEEQDLEDIIQWDAADGDFVVDLEGEDKKEEEVNEDEALHALSNNRRSLYMPNERLTAEALSMYNSLYSLFKSQLKRYSDYPTREVAGLMSIALHDAVNEMIVTKRRGRGKK